MEVEVLRLRRSLSNHPGETLPPGRACTAGRCATEEGGESRCGEPWGQTTATTAPMAATEEYRIASMTFRAPRQARNGRRCCSKQVRDVATAKGDTCPSRRPEANPQRRHPEGGEADKKQHVYTAGGGRLPWWLPHLTQCRFVSYTSSAP